MTNIENVPLILIGSSKEDFASMDVSSIKNMKISLKLLEQLK